ncbi:MAG: DUF1501 domain-containing protein [Gemmataceae bacterium]
MLTLGSIPTGRLDRRGFLTIGSLGLGGSSALPSSLQAAEGSTSHVSGEIGRSPVSTGRTKSVRTSIPNRSRPPDPHRDRRRATRSQASSSATPSQLSKVADKLTVVRSYQTNNAEHNIVPLVSPETLNANIGCLYSRVVGPVRAESGMPTNAVLFPQSACSDVARGSARGNISATGGLAPTFAPFIPGVDGPAQANMRLTLPRDRFDDRRLLLEEFTRLNRAVETGPSGNRLQDQAYRMLLTGGIAEALDLSREAPQTVARYDTSRFVRRDNWSSAHRGARGYYSGQAKSIGKLLLMARRLCEAGCGFVTIHADYEGVWDMHADGENLNMIDGMAAIGRPFDHAVAAFIEDVEARGLQDKILLVCCGEMGRTPRLNRNGGRDHWAKLAPLMMYGGGIQPGRVLGQSTRDGGEPNSEPFAPRHLISTLLHVLFDVGQLRLLPSMASVARLAETPPIPVL